MTSSVGSPANEVVLDLISELGGTWCRIVGEPTDRAPIVLLHGGPGYNSTYLQPFESLAHTGRQVIRYDQIGAGRSTIDDRHFDTPEVFTVELFRRELLALREALGLDEVHLIGQSWGCMLALEHVTEGADGVRSLVLESGLASTEEWNRETALLRAELPDEVRSVLDREEAAGRVGGPEWTAAYATWERTHVLRLDDPPAWERESLALFEQDHRVYDLMTGGAEFATTAETAVGIGGWDIRDRLGLVHAPTLLLSGRFDEATPAIVQTLHDGIADSEWHVLESSSHSCHTEEEALTMLLVADFLARIDSRDVA